MECEFVFPFALGGRQFVLRSPLRLPLDHPVPELAHRLILAHNLLCTFEQDLCQALNEFVKTELAKHEDELTEKSISAVKNGDVDVDHLLNSWTNTFSHEVLEYATIEPPSNDMVFSEVYHSLIHSASLETLLSLEHKYAMAVHHRLEQRDQELLNIENRQRKEMEEAVKLLGITHTDEQINRIAQRQIETTELVESRWASELSNLQELQRREYRDWVMKLHEQSHISSDTVLRLSNFAISGNLHETGDKIEAPVQHRREESFTVHLGAQLKTSHNLRLFSADVLDLCRHRPQSNRGGSLSAHRLQMAISLYSNSLNGLVLLVDNRLNSFTGIKREFAKVCEQSTDFHFLNLEQQFGQIEQSILEAKDWRTRKKAQNVDDNDRISLKSYGSAASIDRDERYPHMQSGDFYITRHSNLSEVHIVFHLVSDDSVCSSVSEISSRHPIIMGYRNILKCCFRYNIQNITLPLLLVHEMSEEMTIPWCLKRAELVFKCVKGFIMELGLWNSQESCTIQFLVPKTLSDETFASLSNMMPTIFRMSNPVIAKS